MKTPIQNTFFEEEDDNEFEFKPSEGLMGKKNRRVSRKKPDIPLPKNETEKEIMNIYGQKPKEKKDLKRSRYPEIPRPSRTSKFVEYEMEDQDFIEEGHVMKPIFSGEIRK